MLKNLRILSPGILLFLIYLISFSSNLGAQSHPLPAGTPSWVLLGQASALFDEKEYSPAILLLRQAIQKRGIYPEAEWLLGKVLGVTGDLTIQREQYKKALDEADLLDIASQKWEILFDLDTNVQYTPNLTFMERFSLRKNWLGMILDHDNLYQEAKKAGTLEGYNRVFFEESPRQQGLDRILFLFRSSPSFATRAHQRMAALYLDAGAPQLSLNHSLLAFVSLISQALNEYTVINPDTEFSSLAGFFTALRGGGDFGSAGQPIRGALRRYHHIWDYLQETGTWETMFMIASASALIDNPQASVRSQEILQLFSTHLPELEWSRKPLLKPIKRD